MRVGEDELGLSVARDQRAEAACTRPSSVPSRTSMQSGATAPILAIAPWLSRWLRARLASAPAALACISTAGEPSIAERGGMAPASAMASCVLRPPLDISLMAAAAIVHSAYLRVRVRVKVRVRTSR